MVLRKSGSEVGNPVTHWTYGSWTHDTSNGNHRTNELVKDHLLCSIQYSRLAISNTRRCPFLLGTAYAFFPILISCLLSESYLDLFIRKFLHPPSFSTGQPLNLQHSPHIVFHLLLLSVKLLNWHMRGRQTLSQRLPLQRVTILLQARRKLSLLLLWRHHLFLHSLSFLQGIHGASKRNSQPVASQNFHQRHQHRSLWIL